VGDVTSSREQHAAFARSGDRDNGNYIGVPSFSIDLMNAVAKRAGLSVTYRVFEAWSDLIAALESLIFLASCA
jgi:ABC-type amino acid transport substrate-binding protein